MFGIEKFGKLAEESMDEKKEACELRKKLLSYIQKAFWSSGLTRWSNGTHTSFPIKKSIYFIGSELYLFWNQMSILRKFIFTEFNNIKNLK